MLLLFCYGPSTNLTKTIQWVLDCAVLHSWLSCFTMNVQKTQMRCLKLLNNRERSPVYLTIFTIFMRQVMKEFDWMWLHYSFTKFQFIQESNLL